MIYLYFVFILVFGTAVTLLMASLSRQPIGQELKNFKFSWRTVYDVVAFWVLIFVLGFFMTKITRLSVLDGVTLKTIFAWRSESMTSVMVFVSNLFEFGSVMAVLAGVFVWLILKKKWETLITWLVTICGSAGSMWVVKHIVMRERPFIGWHLVAENGYSFFSGHSVTAMAVIGLAAWFISQKYSLAGWSRIIAWIIGGLIILTVGFSRLYLGVHYPIDVLTGFAVGAFWIILGVNIVKR
ncbi:MAG: phosphatase PAP2 family protein [bacterium]